MNKNISKLPTYFKLEKIRNDKRVVVYLVCVLIATILWFLNALSKDYSTLVSYPVKYMSPPSHQFLANQPPSKLELKVEAHGFTLLRYKLSLSFSPIVLNLNNITKDIQPQNGTYEIQSSGLLRRIRNQISNEITILEIHPDVILIKLDSLRSKTVPVKADVEIAFQPQFNLKDPISLTPNKINITGPSSILDTILSLSTEKVTYKAVEQNVEKNVRILHPLKTDINPEKILLKIDVEKYTEKEIKIPVLVRNKPDNVNIKLFPSEVKVTCLVGLSEFENLTANDFKAVVDFDNTNGDTKNLNVKIEQRSSFIQLVRFTPESVEYLIETN